MDEQIGRKLPDTYKEKLLKDVGDNISELSKVVRDYCYKTIKIRGVSCGKYKSRIRGGSVDRKLLFRDIVNLSN